MLARRSNHKPILLVLNEENLVARRRKRLFRFEAKWAMEEEGGTIIQKAWARNDAEQVLLKRCIIN